MTRPAIDLTGAPPQLLRQLSRHLRSPSTHDLCRNALRAAAGPASLDEIIVTIWRQTGQVVERRAVHRALTWLRRRGEATRVANGVWQLDPWEKADK